MRIFGFLNYPLNPNTLLNLIRKNHFDNLVFNTITHRNTKLGEAPSFGKPALMYDADSTGATNYLNLAKEILQKNNLICRLIEPHPGFLVCSAPQVVLKICIHKRVSHEAQVFCEFSFVLSKNQLSIVRIINL